MAPSLLFTQCLQHDFLRPLAVGEPLPNLLHVGAGESRRLLGAAPGEGALAEVLAWAHGASDDVLRLFHLRDGHDANDPSQAEHLARFGPHCLVGTEGAALLFPIPQDCTKRIELVDSPGLNDFSGTDLALRLGRWANEPCRVGIVGAWTEAKVSFLAYELKTRYPHFDVAICSALTASSTRRRHFEALDALERLLGVRVLSSAAEFVAFLGGELPVRPLSEASGPGPTLEAPEVLQGEDLQLVRWLFREAREVKLRQLGGGFSGNLVFTAESVDRHGHAQVPYVVKLGARTPIAQERRAFEEVEEVLGNAAPQIAASAELATRAAIQYRYASMGGGATPLQKRWRDGADDAEIERILRVVFEEQLGRFVPAALEDEVDLLAHYAFEGRWGGSVRRNVEAIVGGPAGAHVEAVAGLPVGNPARFYEETLAAPRGRRGVTVPLAFVHGDLNGANVVIDGRQNVWLIDFFHTRRAHAVKDLVKLENDLTFLHTPITDEEQLREAVRVSDLILASPSLAELPASVASELPAIQRLITTVRLLRSFLLRLPPSARAPWPFHVAAFRYAVHTLGFDEAPILSRRWALHVAGRLRTLVEAGL